MREELEVKKQVEEISEENNSNVANTEKGKALFIIGKLDSVKPEELEELKQFLVNYTVEKLVTAEGEVNSDILEEIKAKVEEIKAKVSSKERPAAIVIVGHFFRSVPLYVSFPTTLFPEVFSTIKNLKSHVSSKFYEHDMVTIFSSFSFEGLEEEKEVVLEQQRKTKTGECIDQTQKQYEEVNGREEIKSKGKAINFLKKLFKKFKKNKKPSDEPALEQNRQLKESNSSEFFDSKEAKNTTNKEQQSTSSEFFDSKEAKNTTNKEQQSTFRLSEKAAEMWREFVEKFNKLSEEIWEEMKQLNCFSPCFGDDEKAEEAPRADIKGGNASSLRPLSKNNQL